MSRDDTSPKGEGSIRRYFCGEAAAKEEEAAAEAGADNGAHRLRFGDAGLSSGSKSRVLFKVAPQAMARRGGEAEEWGSERGPRETAAAAVVVAAAAAGPTQRRLPRCLGRAGGEGREGGKERRGQLRQVLRRLPAGLSQGSGPGPPSGSGSAGRIPALTARPAPAGPIPSAAGGGPRAGPRGAGAEAAARGGAADEERWRSGPGGGSGGGASPCRSRTSNMASITTPRVQTPGARTAPAPPGRWRPRRLRGIVVSAGRAHGSAEGGGTTNPGVPRAARPSFRVLV